MLKNDNIINSNEGDIEDENAIETFDDFEDFYRIRSKDKDDDVNSETGLKELDFT